MHPEIRGLLVQKLLKFIYNFLFCLNIPVIMKFLTICSILITLAQADGADPEFCPTKLPDLLCICN